MANLSDGGMLSASIVPSLAELPVPNDDDEGGVTRGADPAEWRAGLLLLLLLLLTPRESDLR